MGEFISARKAKEMLENKPEGLTNKQALQYLVDQGHEIEGLNSSFEMPGLENLADSVAENAKAVWSSVRHPLQTAKSLSGMVQGAMFKLIPDTGQGMDVQDKLVNIARNVAPGFAPFILDAKDSQDIIDGVADFYIDRYGSTERLLNTIERDPIGFASDLASVLQIGGAGIKAAGAATKAGKAVTAAEKGLRAASALGMADEAIALKAATKGAPLYKTGKAIEAIGRFMEPTQVVQQTAHTFNKYLMAPAYKGMATKLMKGAIDMSKNEELNLAGQTGLIGKLGKESYSPVKFLTEHGIWGSLDEMSADLGTIADKSVKVVDRKLGLVPGKYTHKAVVPLADEILGQFENIGKLSDTFSKDYAKILSFRSKMKKRTIYDAAKARGKWTFQDADNVMNGVSKEQLIDINDVLRKNQKRLPSELKNTYLSTEFADQVSAPVNNKALQAIDFIEGNMTQNMMRDADFEVLESIIGKRKTKVAEGLTLKEMNDFRRVVDKYINMYKDTGEVMHPLKTKNLARFQGNLRQFIEGKAYQYGFKDYKKMNRQIQMSRGFKDVIDRNRVITNVTSDYLERWGDRMLLGSGVGAYALGQPQVLAGVAGVMAANKLMKVPKVRSWLASRLQLAAVDDFVALQQDIELGLKNKRADAFKRQLKSDFVKTFPGLRVSGIVDREGKNKQRVTAASEEL